MEQAFQAASEAVAKVGQYGNNSIVFDSTNGKLLIYQPEELASKIAALEKEKTRWENEAFRLKKEGNEEIDRLAALLKARPAPLPTGPVDMALDARPARPDPQPPIVEITQAPAPRMGLMARVQPRADMFFAFKTEIGETHFINAHQLYTNGIDVMPLINENRKLNCGVAACVFRLNDAEVLKVGHVSPEEMQAAKAASDTGVGPKVVRVFNYDLLNVRRYRVAVQSAIVMEKFDGNLDQLTKSEGVTPMTATAFVKMMNIALASDTAPIHGDLHPGNILQKGAPHSTVLRLTDWGQIVTPIGNTPMRMLRILQFFVQISFMPAIGGVGQTQRGMFRWLCQDAKGTVRQKLIEYGDALIAEYATIYANYSKKARPGMVVNRHTAGHPTERFQLKCPPPDALSFRPVNYTLNAY